MIPYQKLLDYIDQKLDSNVTMEKIEFSEYTKGILDSDIKNAKQMFVVNGQPSKFSKQFIANLEQIIANKIKLNDHLQIEDLNIELADCINDKLIMNFLETWNTVLHIQNNTNNNQSLNFLKVVNNAIHLDMKPSLSKSKLGQQVVQMYDQDSIIQSKPFQESVEQLCDEFNRWYQSDESVDSDEDVYENKQKHQFNKQLSNDQQF